MNRTRTLIATAMLVVAAGTVAVVATSGSTSEPGVNIDQHQQVDPAVTPSTLAPVVGPSSEVAPNPPEAQVDPAPVTFDAPAEQPAVAAAPAAPVAAPAPPAPLPPDVPDGPGCGDCQP